MEAVVAGLVGAAGGTYAARKSNKYASQGFNQRMQDAEKYGIHPLQALGGNANFQGTGGANVGQIVNQAKQLKKAQQYQDSVREDVQDHEQNMQLIKDQAENQRLTRRLEAEAKSPIFGDTITDLKNKAGKYWAPVIDTFTDAGDSAGDWIDSKWRDINQHMWDTRRQHLNRRR
jgi:hypothetical protein